MVYDAFIREQETGKDIAEIVVENKMAKYAPGADEEVKLWKTTCLRYVNKIVDEATRVEGDTDEEHEFGIGEDEDFEVYLGFDEQADNAVNVELAKKLLIEFGGCKGDTLGPERPAPPRPNAIQGTPAVAGNNK